MYYLFFSNKEFLHFSRYCFSIFVHYLAVFVIALIVGQVGNVITNRNANRLEFERLLVSSLLCQFPLKSNFLLESRCLCL